MTDPNSPLSPGEIPMSDPVVPPPMGAVPGTTPPPQVDYSSAAATATGPMSPPPPYVGPAPDKDSTTMALLAHLLGIVTGFLGPLVIWLLKKDTSPFVEDQAREALNFQLTILTGYIVAGVMLHVMCIGLLIWPVVFVVNLIFGIIATTKASSGIAYRYPIAIRIIK